MLRAIRPEAGEEPKVLRLAGGCQPRSPADASLHVVGVLIYFFKPKTRKASVRIIRLAEGHQQRRSADAFLLVVGAMINPLTLENRDEPFRIF